MSKRLVLAFFISTLLGCAENLYDTDQELYKRYKYWDTSAQDWTSYGGFDFLIEQSAKNGQQFLYLTPHKQGLPSFQGNYIPASKQLSFRMMEQQCGKDNFDVYRAVKPEQGRIIDRYFYQYQTLSIGVTFACKNAKNPAPLNQDREKIMKWKNASRSIENFNGTDFILYRLKTDAGLYQIKIREMGKKTNLAAKFARQLMLDICGAPDFTIVYSEKSADYAYNQGEPLLIAKDGVYAYGFYCYLNYK